LVKNPTGARMNRFITLVLFFISASLITAQNPPDVQWSKTFSGTGMDWGYYAHQTSDGGYVFTTRVDYGSFNFDAKLIKTNQLGETLWSKTYGSSYIDETYMVKQTADGGYALCGVSTAFGNAGEAWLIRTDNLGNVIWSNGYHPALSGSTSWDYFYDFIENSDGSFTTIGFSYQEGYEWQAWIAKISSTGTMIWSKPFGDIYWDRLYSIQAAADGGFLAVGDTHVQYGDTTAHDGWLVKFNSNGDTLWTKTFGGSQIDLFKFINKTSDGGFIITGEREPVWAMGFYGWIVKTDANGNPVWNKIYTKGGLYGIQECSDGFISAGTTHSVSNGNEGWVMKTDLNGNLIWNKLISETSLDEVITSINKTADGGYILGGRTNSNSDQGSGWLVKLESDQPVSNTNFSENFDGVTPPALPQGWSGVVKVLPANTIAEVKTFLHGSPPSSPNAIFLMNGLNGSNGQLDANAFVALVSPMVTVPGDGGTFSFYALGGNPIKVGTMTDPADTNTFTLIQEFPLSFDFVQYTVHISGAGNKYIVLKHGNTSGVSPLFIDNVSFTAIVPVEMTSFTASVINNGVILNWRTATEVNNRMFEVQRRKDDQEFSVIGIVNGSGTTSEPRNYSFNDNNIEAGEYIYRLRQIDFDGTYSYSNPVNAIITNPESYTLDQNYPNPFNPSTTIKYQIPESGFVTLKIYDLLGNEITSLVSENQTRGNYEVKFDAGSLSSGIYIYQVRVNNFTATRKMSLIK
jgi:hypothetical protein